MKDLEKREIKRISKEFTFKFNNYWEIYQVSPYVIISAIYGDEGKEERMMLFNINEKEIIENESLIRYFSII